MSQQKRPSDIRLASESKDAEAKLLDSLNQSEPQSAKPAQPFPKDFSASGNGKGGGGSTAAIEP